MTLYLTIPLVPPSVNHYVKHTKNGGHYRTKEADAFKMAVRHFSRGIQLHAKKYEIEFMVYLGYNQRGDPDNFAKVIGDGLKESGVIHSDAKVRWIQDTSRDWKNPRTEITVKEL